MKSGQEMDKASDSVVIAAVARSEFADRWRKMTHDERRRILEILAGRCDDDSIRSAVIEVTTGQKSLF